MAVCHHFVLGPRILLPSLACFRDALTVQSYDSFICRTCPRNRDQWVLPSLCFLLHGKLLISTYEKLNTDNSFFFFINITKCPHTGGVRLIPNQSSVCF